MDEKKLKASIGRALQPVQYDQKLYQDVHGASAGTDYERFLSLLFFSPETRTPTRLIFESTGTFPKIEHGSDVIAVWRDTKKNKKAMFLGIIDKDNAHPFNSDLDLSALTIECWTRVLQ